MFGHVEDSAMLQDGIGITRLSSLEVLRAHGLVPFRKILSAELFFSFGKNATRAFTVIVPEILFWLMMTAAMGEKSMAAAVMIFWAPLRILFSSLPAEPITEEAFCIARRSSPLGFFRYIFERVVSRFLDSFGANHLWHGLRLWGVDGTIVDLPGCPHLRETFGTPSNGRATSKIPQGLLVGLVGLWNGLCRDFVLVPLKKGEQRCATLLARCLGPSDLLAMDRNFATYKMIANLCRRGIKFLIRLPETRFHKCNRIYAHAGRPDEWHISLRFPAALQKLCQWLPETLTLRVVKYQLHGFRPSRLVTSLLDTEKYPYDEVVSLYHDRWKQETFHREWKHTLQISNLRSKSKNGILKEVHVQLTLNNVIRWMQAEAAPSGKRPVDLQFMNTKRLILSFIPAMAVVSSRELPTMYRQLLDAIASKVILVRPGRSYPRQYDKRSRGKGNGIYVKPARLIKKQERLREVI